MYYTTLSYCPSTNSLNQSNALYDSLKFSDETTEISIVSWEQGIETYEDWSTSDDNNSRRSDVSSWTLSP